MGHINNVLIVDDDKDFCDSLYDVLEPEGYRISIATDADQALSLLSRTEFNVAFLDIRLGQTNGIELIDTIKRRHPNLICVVMTAFAEMDTAIEAIRMGAYDFLRKPFHMHELIATIDRCFDLLRLELERAEAEEEKQTMQTRLIQSQKMEAIGVLAGGVAHDFNNLLTAIIGNVDLAKLKIDQQSPIYTNLKHIDESAQRAAHLTRQLLLFSKQQPIESAAVDINDTIGSLSALLHRIIGEDIEITTELDHDLWPIMGDGNKIDQALMNLAINSRDAMPTGGQIIVKTENAYVDENLPDLPPGIDPGEFVCLTVEDTGSGIDNAIIESIFEPFFTTKETGTGLGLSVVYGIVKQHGGWVDVESEPGLGSAFRIYLPRTEAEVENKPQLTIALEDLHGSGERILIVEDEAGVRDFAARALGENGYTVFEAASRREAFEIFEREGLNFHLIFSDVVLPDGSGLDLVDVMKLRKSALKILLTSGYTGKRSKWSEIHQKGYPFLQKPFSLLGLLKATQEVIEG